jgi:uncharacterized cupin superfamily protein
MSETTSPVVHVDELEEISRVMGEWGGHYKVLTPSMRPRGGSLGVNLMRVPPGHAAVPFHTHEREDEVFYVLAGRGVLRYGDELHEIRAGHCVSCPAGTGVAHQIGNPFDEELVYLAIGPYDPHEVCRYPDSGKVMVRAIDQVGRLTETPYLDGEPERPRILDLWGGR